MNFNEYQEFTRSLAVYNTDVVLEAVDRSDDTSPARIDVWMPYLYPAMAIGEEAGEVLGKIAKFVRKSQAGVTEDMVSQLRLDVAKELGDVLYQVSETARQFQWTLDDIVTMNQDKLTDRKDRGVLVGEGDNR